MTHWIVVTGASKCRARGAIATLMIVVSMPEAAEPSMRVSASLISAGSRRSDGGAWGSGLPRRRD
ncbi:hypothetical protein [Actinoallomurus iriomotensis]|uniref:Uncharacterized protein n=1 Tax=Actinoallomurus iriomotensis TaxID=478107 RepID=A0A9W6SD24_9ACTN|nr:hypothetical protein [Actinoallomurus iriomotensis]GLY91308.1 hypothetical protein Airi02_092370 [Actinoallomurus iriomotensis]